MAITYDLVRSTAFELYSRALVSVPDDTRVGLAAARGREMLPVAAATLDSMVASAEQAEAREHLVCSDAGIPTYSVRLGTRLTLDGDLTAAIRDAFAELTETREPPILKHVTHPLTHERGYAGRDVPIISVELEDGADHLELTCSPKALGSGKWASMEVFTFPGLEEIERFVVESVMAAGSQPCPPVIVGVGIGGSFDHAAKIAKDAMLRPVGTRHPEEMVAAVESRLLTAVNALGFGPMGTGGAATALAVNVEYAAGHGFVPVAVNLNCWINRRTAARIHDDGTVVML